MGRAPEPRTGSTVLLLINDPTNEQAWDAFVARYAPVIYGWCRQKGLQDADAQDVCQEVLMRVRQKLPEFRYDPQKGTFTGWLRTLFRNALYDYLEAQGRPGRGTGDSAVMRVLEMVAAPEELLAHLDKVFAQELLEEALRRLSLKVKPRDIQIFKALKLDGRSTREVAPEHQMTEAAVLMVVSRVWKKLKDEIARLEGGACAA